MYCALLLPGLTKAQVGAINNNDVAKQKTIAVFYNTVNDNAGLYNGTEYVMYDQHIKGTPYFMDGGQQGADIFFNGTLYTNVPLIYEITTDNVVARLFGQGLFIDLVNEKIKYFTLYGHTFVHLFQDSTNKIISDGFYDRLYNGQTSVFVKRGKSIYEDPHTFEKSFVENDHYYIYKNGTFYQVSGKGSVLNVFKDKKKDLSKYLRQNDIDFKKDPENAMVQLAEYYDKLTH